MRVKKRKKRKDSRNEGGGMNVKERREEENKKKPKIGKGRENVNNECMKENLRERKRIYEEYHVLRVKSIITKLILFLCSLYVEHFRL